LTTCRSKITSAGFSSNAHAKRETVQNCAEVGQFDERVWFAREIPRAAGENAALRNDAGLNLALARANCTNNCSATFLLFDHPLNWHFQPPIRLQVPERTEVEARICPISEFTTISESTTKETDK